MNYVKCELIRHTANGKWTIIAWVSSADAKLCRPILMDGCTWFVSKVLE